MRAMAEGLLADFRYSLRAQLAARAARRPHQPGGGAAP
jgi:hypothetical protein